MCHRQSIQERAAAVVVGEPDPRDILLPEQQVAPFRGGQ